MSGDRRRGRAATETKAGGAPARRERPHPGAAVPALSSEVIEAALYRAAEGDPTAEATAYILTEEGSFVRQADLYALCLEWSDDGRYATVRWPVLREFVSRPDSAYQDGPLRTLLLLCCALHDDGPVPLTRLSSLDTTNARIVSRGIHIATGKLPLSQALGTA